MDDGDSGMRLRFYGLNDFATFYQLEQVFTLLEDVDVTRLDYTVNDVIELHHAAEFARRDMFPRSSNGPEKQTRRAQIPNIARVVGTFFTGLTDDTIQDRILDIDYQYRGDVLDLMARSKVFERCSARAVLTALVGAKLHCSDVLSCQALVKAYDAEIREFVLSEPQHAEQLIAKYLQADSNEKIHMPASFTPRDSRAVLDAYVDSTEANPNFLKLIATARVVPETGIDARLKLKAKRKYEERIAALFEGREGVRSGCEVCVQVGQAAPVVESLDGLVGKYSFSREWLSEDLTYPSILNNFAHLFEFTNKYSLLLLPSYPSQLGVMERLVTSSGPEGYLVGAWFRLKDQASFLQTFMYENFLRDHGVELEAVIKWFFEQYLQEEFGVEKFKFRASSAGATYLEKSRHLFAEMESVLKQFSLFVEDGELDPDLLAISSGGVIYKQIPSLVPGKYAYVTDHRDINRIQYLLFSDQSPIHYISEELRGDTFAHLIIANDVAYETFHEYQQVDIDHLFEQGIVKNEDGKVQFVSAAQLLVLRELSDHQAASYYRFSLGGQAAIDTMVELGWLRRSESLLTGSEASYFNYYLNQSEFSDGPDLRNRYLHGTQADGEDDRVHRQVYFTALKLLVALVIKLNEDFCIADSPAGSATEVAGEESVVERNDWACGVGIATMTATLPGISTSRSVG